MESVWSAGIKKADRKPRPSLKGNIKTDVLVIGGGMAGILTAYRLGQAGVNCVVVEGRTVGDGITKNTTAKVTAQHGLIYGDIIRRRGLEMAKAYLKANQQAVADFRNLSKQYPCDFEEKTAYVYSRDRRDKLEQEARAYEKMGLAADWREKVPVPVETAGTLGMAHQGQIHPLKLIFVLAENINIYENTFVRKIENGVAETDNGEIHAEHIVLATHYPMVNVPGLYFMKLYQHRSYVIALEGAQAIDGMYVDAQQDGYSFRTYQDLLFVGGGSHKTGKQGGDLQSCETLRKGVAGRGRAFFLGDPGLYEFGQYSLYRTASGKNKASVRCHRDEQMGHDRLYGGESSFERFNYTWEKRIGSFIFATPADGRTAAGSQSLFCRSGTAQCWRAAVHTSGVQATQKLCGGHMGLCMSRLPL